MVNTAPRNLETARETEASKGLWEQDAIVANLTQIRGSHQRDASFSYLQKPFLAPHHRGQTRRSAPHVALSQVQCCSVPWFLGMSKSGPSSGWATTKGGWAPRLWSSPGPMSSPGVSGSLPILVILCPTPTLETLSHEAGSVFTVNPSTGRSAQPRRCARRPCPRKFPLGDTTTARQENISLLFFKDSWWPTVYRGLNEHPPNNFLQLPFRRNFP